MPEPTPTKEIQTTVELSSEVVDDIVSSLDSDPSELRIRDACFDHIDRETTFVTADGQRVAQVVRDR